MSKQLTIATLLKTVSSTNAITIKIKDESIKTRISFLKRMDACCIFLIKPPKLNRIKRIVNDTTITKSILEM